MKISLNWLKEYIKTDKNPEDLGRILTDIGLEVESIEKVDSVQGGLEGVVVGEVMTCEKHPDADKLKVTTVNVGTGENLQIVCGAPNVAAGQKVLVATVGCTLYPKPDEAFKIKSSKIRGVDSNGMLCAEDELGIGQSHDGILVLPNDTQVGIPAAAYLDLESDHVFEIGLTPNRADAMSHIGVARDICAYINVHESPIELVWPTIQPIEPKADLPVDIQIEYKEACHSYCGLTLKGVKVQASPVWLQKRLRSIGLSPINNVVDCTNFVMHELGTPLHAFDLRSVGKTLVVKQPQEGESFITLDGVERKLNSEDNLITNGTDNLCLAGVFGGINSGIKDDTQDVFLESAYFNPVLTRKMARRHGLNTDASFRFERGVDPALTMFALRRCANLIKEVAGGEYAMSEKQVGSDFRTQQEVPFSVKRCQKLMGSDISEKVIFSILTALDIKVLKQDKDEYVLSVPAYRVDVTREADIVEEVLRIYGFNRIELPNKLNTSIPQFPSPNVEAIQHKLSNMLVGLGFSEMMNNSLTSAEYVAKLGGECLSSERNVEILNPLSLELNVMRQSLIFQGLSSAAFNQNRQNPDLRLFEFGKTYHKFETYTENKRLLLLTSGRKSRQSWNTEDKQHDFYTMKGYVMSLFGRLGLDGMIKFRALKKSLLEDGLQIYVLQNKVGELGWPSAETRKFFGLKSKVFVADLDWDAIIASLSYVKVKYQELPKTFSTRRDFSLLLDSKVSFAEIEDLAKSADRKILREVGLFDVYEGKNLPEGKKSYAVSFTFQDNEKTLQDPQVDSVMDKIQNLLEQKLGAELRS